MFLFLGVKLSDDSGVNVNNMVKSDLYGLREGLILFHSSFGRVNQFVYNL